MTAALIRMPEDILDEPDLQRWMCLDEVLDIAEAVLGGAPLPYNHPGTDEALKAMRALGYGTRYMAEQLSMATSTVINRARKIGAPLDPSRGYVDHLAVNMVVDEGVPLRLRNHDLLAALPRLAAAGKTASECAKLLCTNLDMIKKYADELDLELAEPAGGACWWVGYVDERKKKKKS